MPLAERRANTSGPGRAGRFAAPALRVGAAGECSPAPSHGIVGVLPRRGSVDDAGADRRHAALPGLRVRVVLGRSALLPLRRGRAARRLPAAPGPPPLSSFTPREEERDLPDATVPRERGFGDGPEDVPDPMPAELAEGAAEEERRLREADTPDGMEGEAPTG